MPGMLHPRLLSCRRWSSATASSPSSRFHGAGSLDYGRPLDGQIIGSTSFDPPPSKPAVAESKPGGIRALRLPNGKIIFTNRVELGGGSDEKKNAESVRAAAGEIQGQDRATYAGRSGIQTQMTDLLRAAIDNHGGSMQPGAGEANLEAVDQGYDSQSPGVSAIQGSPEQQDELAMESGRRELGLTRLQQEMKAAKMSPEQAARLGHPNPQIEIGDKVMKQMNDAKEAIANFQDRNSPFYIKDQVERQRKIAEVQGDIENTLRAYNLKAF
jgi:hypothetical protein